MIHNCSHYDDSTTSVSRNKENLSTAHTSELFRLFQLVAPVHCLVIQLLDYHNSHSRTMSRVTKYLHGTEGDLLEQTINPSAGQAVAVLLCGSKVHYSVHKR
jgi:hypothetical protein